MPNGIPSRDVIRRVLCALKPEVCQECFDEWISGLLGSSTGAQDHVAIDGKTLRGTSDSSRGIGPLLVVSAWASEKGVTPAQVPADQKSSEITAIFELLSLIDLENSIDHDRCHGDSVYTFIGVGEVQTDIRYYLCSLPLYVSQFAKCVRSHGASKTPVTGVLT